MNKLTQLAFLRNGELYSSRNEAIEGLRRTMTNYGQDGTMVLARYRDSDSTEVKTLFGLQYSCPDGHDKFMTIFNSDNVITENIKQNHSKEEKNKDILDNTRSLLEEFINEIEEYGNRTKLFGKKIKIL